MKGGKFHKTGGKKVEKWELKPGIGCFLKYNLNKSLVPCTSTINKHDMHFTDFQ